jgi:branched-chain amino acid transport system permease protein
MTVRLPLFLLLAVLAAAAVFTASLLIRNDYVFFAGYVVLNYVVLATAWNILGGYCGYVNFGSAAFFALGAYSSVVLHKAWPLPIPLLILVGGIVSGVVGLGVGYLTLRLRGVFFAIATLALAIVLQTLIINWDYVGGSRGAYIIRPQGVSFLNIQLTYIQYLYLIMLALAVIAVTIARAIEGSRLGYGFATIRDDELAAEASGVPTLRLKLIATTLSGALMGMSGAPFPYYIGYLEPASAFGLAYAVNAIAMPMIGGTSSWLGPLIGAVLLGSLQQIATVTISSAVNLLIVGVLLVLFVIIAPNGILGERATDKRLGIAALIIAIFAAFIPGYGVYLGWIALAAVTFAALYGDRAFTAIVLGISALHYFFLNPVFWPVWVGAAAVAGALLTAVLMAAPIAVVTMRVRGKGFGAWWKQVEERA